MTSQQGEKVTFVQETVLYEERYKPCFLWTLILAPCLLPVVWNYHVRITSSELSIGFSSGCASLTVDRSKIITVEDCDVRPVMDWGGWGIRFQLPSMNVGYIPKKGRGVKMVIKLENGKEKGYTFVCNDPETVIGILTS